MMESIHRDARDERVVIGGSMVMLEKATEVMRT